MLALAAAPFAVVPVEAAAAAALPSICLFSAGLLIVEKPKPGRALATLGILGLFGTAAQSLVESPALALSALLILLTSLGSLWDILGRPAERLPLIPARAFGAALAALVFWTAATLIQPLHSPREALAIASAFLIAIFTGLDWAWRNRRERPRHSAALFLAAAASVALAAIPASTLWPAASAGALYAVTALALLPRERRGGIEPIAWWEPLLGHPERLLVGTFLLLCLAGTVLLALPASAAGASGIGLLDAAFTAVSAVCVTGLIVLDTPRDFSLFGQAMILLLIQVGGLGIMTFATAVLRVLGRRMSLKHEGAAASLINLRDRRQLAQSARRILQMTLVAEFAGAALLLPRFLAHGDGWGEALWRSVFTAVSAFCNAGFALQSQSLIPYRQDPIVLHVVALLIIAGGLSPLTVNALPSLVRRGGPPVPVQARAGLLAALVLLFGGFLFLLAVEWNHALADLGWMDRLHNAWFQSATLRTAGFNSLDFAVLQPATLTLAMLWMFIGGGPGGTAGGIKTTTAAVLLLSVSNVVRGSARAVAFDRYLGERTRHRATAVTLLAAATVIAAVTALQLTQPLGGLEALFEVVSALGTVGLSIGATPKLDEIGKVIIMAAMFTGRVGGLSLLMFMSQRSVSAAVSRPEEEIDVG